MGIWRKAWRVIGTSGRVALGVIASLISIASFVGMLVADDRRWVAWVAILFFVLFLITILVSLLRVLNRYLESARGGDKKYGDYKHIASFLSYTCDDDGKVVMETYKWIQVRCSLMWEYPLRFKWSGTKEPKAESDIQEVTRTDKRKGGGFDHAILKFKQALIYNDVAVIHVRYIADDADHKSKTMMGILVDKPVECIHVRVSLGYKSESEPAKILRRKREGDGEPLRDFEEMECITFDARHRCYAWKLVNPDVGYDYRLEWER